MKHFLKSNISATKSFIDFHAREMEKYEPFSYMRGRHEGLKFGYESKLDLLERTLKEVEKHGLVHQP